MKRRIPNRNKADGGQDLTQGGTDEARRSDYQTVQAG